MRARMFCLYFILCLTPVLSWGREENSVILVLQRRSLVGLEQSSLTLQGRSVRFVQNSNFLRKEFPIYLGVFHSSSGSLVQELKKFKGKKVKPMAMDQWRSPHRMQVLLNGTELEPTTDEYKRIVKLLKGAQSRTDWKRSEGTQVKSVADLYSLGCAPVSQIPGVCKLPTGIFHLPF